MRESIKFKEYVEELETLYDYKIDLYSHINHMQYFTMSVDDENSKKSKEKPCNIHTKRWGWLYRLIRKLKSYYAKM